MLLAVNGLDHGFPVRVDKTKVEQVLQIDVAQNFGQHLVGKIVQVLCDLLAKGGLKEKPSEFWYLQDDAEFLQAIHILYIVFIISV